MSTPSNTDTIQATEAIQDLARGILTTIPPNGKYTPLENITSDKYLGVTLDHHLSFNEHIDTITRTASTLLNLCSR
jgi:hypothetical protein